MATFGSLPAALRRSWNAFDVEVDAEQLAEEQQGLQPEVPIDPRTGQPIDSSVKLMG
jgi:hypothetical protein